MKSLLVWITAIMFWSLAIILQEQVFDMSTPWVMIYGYVVGTVIFDSTVGRL